MASHVKLFATPEGARRRMLRKGMDLFGSHIGGILMTTGPNPKCAHLNEPLLAQYQKAMDDFPELLNQLLAHLTYNAEFGEEFTKIFG